MNGNTYENLAALIQPSTTDRELELIAAAATATASAGLLADLRDVRDRQRGAVPPRTLADEQLLVRSVMDLGVAELITYRTTNEEIAAYVVAAEVGAGGPLFGLKEELTTLRDQEIAEWRVKVDVAKEQLLKKENERARRVFVGGAYGAPVSVSVPRIGNLAEVFDEDVVAPGESGCRFGYSYHVPDPVSSMTVPRIGNVGETAEERRRIDEIKAGLRVEDL